MTVNATGAAAGGLEDALRQYAADGFSGIVRVDGQPGGALYFTDGGICACETPGAPSLEVILLRSGRVAEADWNAAFSAAAVAKRALTDELTTRGLLGTGEIEALLRTALADALFALLSGQAESWSGGPAADCLLPLDPAARPGWLLGEAARRRQVLAGYGGAAVAPGDRLAPTDQVAPAGETEAGSDEPGEPSQGAAGVLALADGRRSARDLAFARGQGLYETLLELTRMRAAGQVQLPEPGSPAPAPGKQPARRGLTPGMWLLRPRSAGHSVP